LQDALNCESTGRQPSALLEEHAASKWDVRLTDREE
jgi:hypothetical protein